MFKHYIVTRFNLRRKDWVVTKNKEQVLSDLWLEERFELFENFCFPSVKNQVNQNFKWLVFFDTNTPQKYRQRIKEYAKEFNNFCPYFIDGMGSFVPAIIETVQSLDNEEYIITSRLDNDDSLHKNYVNVVQSYFSKQVYMAIDLIDGYGMQVGEKVRLGKMRHLYNPYISLIEKKEDCKTVWHKGHTFWKYEKNIFQVKNISMWLTIIHKKNKSNKFRGFSNVNSEVLKDFNINPSKLTKLIADFELYDLWKLDSFKNKYYLYMAYFSKRLKKYTGFYTIKKLFDKNRYD